MAAVNKNFVIKNGLEVDTNLILANSQTNKVGIGTTVPQYTLHVNGGIGVTNAYVSGITTVINELRVGTGGTVLTVLGVGNSIGIGTALPAFLLDVRAPVSTGATALYVQGDVRITGDLVVQDDLVLDEVTSRNITVSNQAITLNLSATGVGTITTLNSTNGTITNLTSTNLNVIGIGTIVTGNITNLTNTNLNVTGIATIATLNATGIAVTNLTVYNNLSVGGISTFTNGPILVGTSVSTGTASQPLQVTGGAYVSGKIGIGTTNPSVVLDVIGDVKVLGVSTFTNANNPAIQIRSGATGSYTGLGVGRVTSEGLFAIASGAGIFAANSSAGDLVIRTESASAKLLLLNGSSSSALAVAGNNVLVGTGTSTGTASQPLQVTGGAYVSGNLGIGTTNPTSKLDVIGDVRVTGVITATTFSGNVNAGVGTITTLGSTNGTITNLTGTSGTITTLNSTSGTITNLTGTAATIGNVVISSGIVTASSGIVTYFGDGSKLTNILSGVGVATAGGTVGTGATILDFRGAGISNVTVASGIATINITGGGTGGTPGGSNTEIQYNNFGVFGGVTGFTYNGTNLNFTGIITATTFVGALTGTASSTTNIPNLTGAITSVNTTTSLGSFTSAQLATALTDETGTGALVFATSPTLVTPVLGAATATSIVVGSGVTINASGINAAAGIVTATTFVGALTGTASSTTNIPNLTGDITSVNKATTLATVNSNVGTFGSGGAIPSITVNAKGLITGVTTTAASGGGLTLSDDTSTNATRYLTFTSATSGSISAANVSSTKLTFNPSTGVLTVVDLNSTSDINLKENIHTVKNALEITEQLRGVSFDWKETGRSSYGVIAQELEEVLPELVGDGGVKSVNYNGIIGVLIEAIKELKKEVEELKRTK